MDTRRPPGKLGRRERDRTIERVLGSALGPLGFELGGTSRDAWRYVRVKGGYRRFYDPSSDEVRQYIDVGESAVVVPEGFLPALSVRFSTDTRLNLTPEDVHRDRCKWSRMFPWAIGLIRYEGREGLEEALRLVLHIVDEYGLGRLEELSAESEEIPTRAMQEELSFCHGQLADRFEGRYLAGLPARPATPQEVLRMVGGISSALSEAEALPYERAKPLLVSIAAFLLRASCEIAGARAVFREDGTLAQLKQARRHGVAARCVDPLNSVIQAWRGRLGDVPEYTSLLLHATAVDPDRPREELALDPGDVVRSVIGPVLEGMGFAFEGIPEPGHGSLRMTWAYVRHVGGTFYRRMYSPSPAPSRLVTVSQACQYAKVTYEAFSGILGLTFTSDVDFDTSSVDTCDALDHKLRRTYPDYLGEGSFYIYGDDSFREAAAKIARMAPELAEVYLKARCPQVGEYLAPEWLVEGDDPS